MGGITGRSFLLWARDLGEEGEDDDVTRRRAGADMRVPLSVSGREKKEGAAGSLRAELLGWVNGLRPFYFFLK